MADRVLRERRQWLNVTGAARKSAPVRAGGVNAQRLLRFRRAREEEEEEEETEPQNECQNPFCRQLLTNRYARFCEDKPMCQRYRALKLQCVANAQAEEDEEDTRPLALVLKRKRKGEKKETFAIPRKKKNAGKRRLNLSADSDSNSSSPRRKEKMLKKRKKDKMKRSRETMETPSRSPSLSSVEHQPLTTRRKKRVSSQNLKIRPSESAGSSSAEEYQPLADRLKKRLSPPNSKTRPSDSAGSSSAEENRPLAEILKRRAPKTRQEITSNTDTRTGAVQISRIKKRRLNRHVSADDVLTRSASSSPVHAAEATEAETNSNWKIPRTKPARAKTAAQAIRNMNVELVPLGVASQASAQGGGRYVQNGNRSTAQLVRPTNPRSRSVTKTKFTPPPIPPVPPSVAPPSVPSRPPQPTLPTVPAPQAPQIQPSLPPLPRPSAPMSRPFIPARTVTPSSSPAKTSPVMPGVNSSSISTARPSAPTRSGTSEVRRISASDYLKNRKNDLERRTQNDQEASRSSSVERSTRLSDDHTSAFQPPPSYPPGPTGYRRTDSVPLPSYRDSHPAVDLRRLYPEADVRHRRPYYGMEGNRMEYLARSDGRGELNDNSTSGEWGARNFPPSRDRYPPRQQDMAPFGATSDGYGYAADTHFNPPSPPAEELYWREPSRSEPPPQQRAPSPRRNEPPPPQRAISPRRNELERTNNDRENSDRDELDVDTPTFSYHDDFVPRLLYVFIHKLPQSLEAVFNVTKKPRKMNWYIKYVERIERLCKAFDLHIKFDGLKACVTVHDREWLTLHGSSTVTLYLDIIKSLRAEAMTWLRLFEEMENALAHYQGLYGNLANESYTFLRAWNDLKNPGNYISLLRQTNYFCGARLHHWNFVVGKVEIGSGSHEEKREAFRLATVSALDFLLSIGRGVRPKRENEVNPERALGTNRSSSRWRSPRRESVSNASVANDQAIGVYTDHSVEQATAGSDEPPSSTEPQPAEASSTAEPQMSAEPSASSATMECTGKLVAVRTFDSNGNGDTEAAEQSEPGEVTEAAEQSEPGEEMNISVVDTSDQGAVTPAGSAPAPTGTPSESSSDILLTASGSGAKTAASTTQAMSSTASVESKPPSTRAMTLDGVSAQDAKPVASTSTPVSQMKSNAAVPLRRCMMCEMIRMRKPDGERCLRCQQKGVPANARLDTSLGP